MQKVAEWVDRPCDDEASEDIRRKRAKRRGIDRIDHDLQLDPRDLCDTVLSASDESTLLLLHGTFSHTEAAFAGLRRATDEWGHLSWSGTATAHVRPRTRHLEQDARRERPRCRPGILPEGAKLHLVSHSRGGLVGEAFTLTRAPDEKLNVLDPFPPSRPSGVRPIPTPPTSRP